VTGRVFNIRRASEIRDWISDGVRCINGPVVGFGASAVAGIEASAVAGVTGFGDSAAAAAADGAGSFGFTAPGETTRGRDPCSGVLSCAWIAVLNKETTRETEKAIRNLVFIVTSGEPQTQISTRRGAASVGLDSRIYSQVVNCFVRVGKVCILCCR
jgi:uncharacterized protein YegL